jgi:hypothetical protein
MRLIKHRPTGKAFAVSPDKKMHRLSPKGVVGGTVTTAMAELYPFGPVGSSPCFLPDEESVRR